MFSVGWCLNTTKAGHASEGEEGILTAITKESSRHKPEDYRVINLISQYSSCFIWYHLPCLLLSNYKIFPRPLLITCLLPSASAAVMCFLPWPRKLQSRHHQQPKCILPTLKNLLTCLLATGILLPLILLQPSSLLFLDLPIFCMLLFVSTPLAFHLNYLHQS
jgi:hypothetical protein